MVLRVQQALKVQPEPMVLRELTEHKVQQAPRVVLAL
jgi:hypothetical protein